jgi:uncharacterized membrane protein YphA (DoxX/SURF4 family)
MKEAAMDVLFLIGRIVFGGYFLFNGMNHFRNRSMLTQYATSKGVPAPGLAVVGTGLLLLLGGLSVLLGFWPQYGLWLIAAFLIGVSPQMHNFWAVSDPNQKMADMVNFTKNMALLGAALMMLRLTGGPWPFSLGR